MSDPKPSKLKQAFGELSRLSKEVIMIIVGISLALWVDKWQDEVKNRQELVNIYGLILEDIWDDTTDLGNNIREYKTIEGEHRAMMLGQYSKEEIKNCEVCQGLMTDYPFLILETRGLEALKAFDYDIMADTLPSYLISMMEVLHEAKDLAIENVMEDSESNLKYWRDNFGWFNEVYNEVPNDDFIDYLANNPQHKNRLAYHHSLVYEDLVPVLEFAKEEYIIIMNALLIRLKDNGLKFLDGP